VRKYSDRWKGVRVRGFVVMSFASKVKRDGPLTLVERAWKRYILKLETVRRSPRDYLI